MKIDLHNYEAFFLDHKEGNLSEAQEKELSAFLEMYPELKAELENFEELVLEPDALFGNRSSLKKIEFSNEELIAYTEGIADEGSKRQIEKMAAENTALKKELALYRSSVLMADAGIKFENKAKLKKKGGVVIYLQNNPVYLRAAAAILLMFGLFLLVSRFNSDPNSESKKTILAKDSKKQNEVPAKNNSVELRQEKTPELAVTDQKEINVKQQNANHTVKQIKKNDAPVFATNTVTVVKDVAVLNNAVNAPDTINSKTVPAVNTAVADNNTSYKSYYNYPVDDEDEAQPVTTSAAPAKKTFFQKLTGAAKKVNGLGVKKVNGAEDQNKNSLNIGGLVLSETVSN